MPEYKDEHLIINAWSEGFTVKYVKSTEITFYNKNSIDSYNYKKRALHLL